MGKVYESIACGQVSRQNLNSFLNLLKFYSAPHLLKTCYLKYETEYENIQNRTSIFIKTLHSLEIAALTTQLLLDEEHITVNALKETPPNVAIIDGTKFKSGDHMVRAINSSNVHGDINNLLTKLGCRYCTNCVQFHHRTSTMYSNVHRNHNIYIYSNIHARLSKEVPVCQFGLRIQLLNGAEVTIFNNHKEKHTPPEDSSEVSSVMLCSVLCVVFCLHSLTVCTHTHCTAHTLYYTHYTAIAYYNILVYSKMKSSFILLEYVAMKSLTIFISSSICDALSWSNNKNSFLN